MPIIPDHPQQPPGGHHFPDPSGVTLRGDSPEAVAEAIASYRAANALPSGHPDSELESYYRTQFPWLISKVGQTVTSAPSLVEAWLNRIWREAPRDIVERRQAEAIHAPCATCAHHIDTITPDPEHAYRLTLLARGQPLAMDGCTLNRWVPGVAAWFPVCHGETHKSCPWRTASTTLSQGT